MIRVSYLLLFLAYTPLFASDAGGLLSLPENEISAALRKTAMPDLGEGRLAKILNRYYHKGLGGPEKWEKLKSLNLVGTMKAESDVFQLTTYQKKPNLIKISLVQEEAQDGTVLAYDGKDAWRQSGRRAEPEKMTGAEARGFIHHAHFANHLLYPLAKGKRISLIDTVPVEGMICHQIRVKLDTDFQVDYFIDIRSYLQIKIVNTDLQSGKVQSFFYDDYVRKQGVPIARKIEIHEEDKTTHSIVIDEVKVNSGVMPWMFHMPQP